MPFQRALRVSPVVVLLGARQTGKTTLVRSHPALSQHTYLTLGDFDLRTQATQNPEVVAQRANLLIVEEVQRSRDLLIAIKRAVDDDPQRTRGQFVLTGSANLLMTERVAESLAGRAIYVTLWPFTRRERQGSGTAGAWQQLVSTPISGWRDILNGQTAPREDWRAAVHAGGLPVPSRELTDDAERQDWYRGYTQTYLERDIQDIRVVEHLPDFRRLLRAASLRIGSLLNQTELGRDVGISQPQVHRFLNIMETSYQIIRLPAYSVNRTRRLIKAPKLYWSDTGLAMHVAGETEPRGAHLENLVLLDLLAWRDSAEQRPEILYWRTTTGAEVDFVIETPRRLLPVEVKSSARVTSNDAVGLETFLSEYGDGADGGLLLYGGDETFPLTRRVWAAPWWRVC